MKRALALLLIALFTVSLLGGCNTMRGAGQDIEEGGEAIQESANGDGDGY
ncbi:entericidin A/B family lipoprotein [Billgrantia azerbaijanica]|nr:entericidin A/B family lipoprotein [Halomonas azerbaijanica]